MATLFTFILIFSGVLAIPLALATWILMTNQSQKSAKVKDLLREILINLKDLFSTLFKNLKDLFDNLLKLYSASEEFIKELTANSNEGKEQLQDIEEESLKEKDIDLSGKDEIGKGQKDPEEEAKAIEKGL